MLKLRFYIALIGIGILFLSLSGCRKGDESKDISDIAYEQFCVPNPCENGSVCSPGEKGPICNCVDGFWGSSCEKSCVSSGRALARNHV